jgi:accessory gene regulator B
MFRNWAEDITFILIKNKIVDIEEREIYLYGLEVFLLNASLMVIITAMSLVFGAVMHLLAFVVVFLPLRIFGGGYHANSSEKCIVLSTTVYALSLVFVSVLPIIYTSIIAVTVYAISIIVIFVLAPQESKNHKLDAQQYRRNRVVVRLLLIVNLVIFVLCYLHQHEIIASVIIYIGIVCISLIVGRAMRRRD